MSRSSPIEPERLAADDDTPRIQGFPPGWLPCGWSPRPPKPPRNSRTPLVLTLLAFAVIAAALVWGGR